MVKQLLTGIVFGGLILLCGSAFAAAAEDVHPELPSISMLPFEAQLVELPEIPTVVLEGTLGGDIEALFMEMFALVSEQELWGDETEVGAVFPFAMGQGWDQNSVIYVGVSREEGAEVNAPLFAYDIPGGEYLQVMHYGPYEDSEATWIAAFEWAAQHGIELSTGPAFEHYLDDPETTAPENLRTEIYIPLVPGQGAVPMQQGAESADKHGAHHGGMDGMGDMEGAPEFNVYVEAQAGLSYFVYLEGTASDDFGMMITAAVEECAQQGLLDDTVHVAAVYPDAMANGYSETTPVYFGVGLEELAEVAAPLGVIAIPEGDYLFAEHYGDYAGLADFWMQVFEWAVGHSIEFDERPCAEIYVSDPSTTPVEEVLTLVMIPIAPEQAHAIE